jgi:protein-ribulosamine 3-kinase
VPADTAPLRDCIATETGRRLDASPSRRVGGGCINECVRWESDAGPLFVKLSGDPGYAMFEAEADGLRALAATGAVRVPRVIGVGTTGRNAFLALEWIELSNGGARTDTLLGEQLAEMHRSSAKGFGWHRDNTIGSTPQHNDRSSDWPRFFARQRLDFQLKLAEQNGAGRRLVERGRLLSEQVEAILGGRQALPSLLHGDLWCGNRSADASGSPVVFDPAPYYGDREVDLAMTRLFGGFRSEFYAAYESAWPLDAGAESRATLYNLYHVLNHLNLFGGGYGAQAQAMIDALLSQTGH